MTTAHRPTFDQAKAKNKRTHSTIQHKRALPGYKELKYRKKAKTVDEDFDDEEEEDEGKRREFITRKDVVGLIEAKGGEEKEVGEDKEEEGEIEEKEGVDEEGEDGEEEEESEDDGDDSQDETSESQSDSDSDAEELRKELEKIRKEREVKEASVEKPAQTKSWRSQSAFHNQKKAQWDKNTRPDLQNDTLKSDFHRRFMDSYFK